GAGPNAACRAAVWRASGTTKRSAGWCVSGTTHRDGSSEAAGAGPRHLLARLRHDPASAVSRRRGRAPRSQRSAREGGQGRTAPLVLGIETSCDETGAGLVRGHELLADAIASSVAEHARFGGVVPEVASRAHLEAMVPAVDRALATAG